jgi:hypothetical protein
MEGQRKNSDLPIGPHTTVREAVQKYPGIEAVFEQHGLGGCGGPDGPIEPVLFFARVHQIDPVSLLRDLNDYAARGGVPRVVEVLDDRKQQPLEPWRIAVFMALGIALLGGFPLGILAALGGAHDVGVGTRWAAIIQGHGHLQVVGFAAVFIAGIAYHVLPRFKNTDLALPQLAIPSILLLASGAILRAATQPWSDNYAVASLMVLSGVIELAGAVAFAGIVLETLRKSARKNYDRYLGVAAVWFVLASAANLALLLDIAADGFTVVPASREAPLLLMYLLGFITLFILGVSVRVLPHFLSLRPPRIQWFAPALALILGGLVAEIGAAWVAAFSDWSQPDWLRALGVYAIAAGFVAFVGGLNLHRPSVRDQSSDRPGPHEKLIRTAYVWLAIAIGIEVWYATKALAGDFQPDFLQNGAARHALALGFMVQIMLGVGSRALPSFAGRQLYSARLVTWAWILLNVAAITRVVTALFPLGDTTSRFDHVALSGAIGIVALGLFTYNLWQTVRPRTRRKQAPRGESIAVAAAAPTVGPGVFRATPDSIVADVLVNIPGSLELLISYGFAPLADPQLRTRITPTVTLGSVCAMQGLDVASVIGDLNRLQDEVRAGA